MNRCPCTALYCLAFLIIAVISASAQVPVRPNKTDPQNRRQGEWVIWYDEGWNELPTADKAIFYRLIQYKDDLPQGKVVDYYQNGVRQWEGFLLKDRPEVFEGLQTWYYDNGSKKNEVFYKNNEVTAATSYLRDGNLANPNWEEEYSNAAFAAYESNDYAGAVRLYREALPHIEATIAKESEEYADILEWLDLLYYELGRDQEIKRCEEDLVYIYSKIRPPGDKDYLKAIYNLARYHKGKSDWDKAESLYDEFLRREASHTTGFHEMHGMTLSALADIYMETTRYQEAVRILEQALSYYAKHPPAEPVELDLAKIHMNRARFLTGSFAEGRKFMLAELNRVKTSKGENSEDYVMALSSLANFSRMNGQLREAEGYYLKAVDIIEKINLKSLTLIVSTTVTLAEVYEQLGLPHRAEKYINQTAALFETADKSTTEYHVTYIGFLKRLIMYYTSLGRDKESERALTQLQQSARTAYGEQSSEYAYSLTARAEFLIRLKQYSAALPHLAGAEKVFRQFLPSQFSATDLRTFAKALQLSGTAHYMLFAAGNESSLPTADRYLIECEGVYQRLPDQGFIPEIIDLYLMRALIREVQGKREEADKLYTQCLDIVKKHFGEDHVYYANILFGIAKKSEVREDVARSYRHYKEALTRQNKYIRAIFPYLSTAEKESFYQANSVWITNFQSFASLHYGKEAQLADELYDLQLSNKGVVMQSINAITAYISEKGDRALRDLYNEWRAKKNDLVKSYQQSIQSGSVDQAGWKALEEHVNSLEKKISERSTAFSDFVKAGSIGWKQVQQKLGPKEAALEITYIPREITGDTIYAALIIRKDVTHPVIVEIGKAQDLEGRPLKFYRNAILLGLTDEQSYVRYWSAIAKQLAGIERAFVSADGVYHQVNLATLFDPTTKKYVFDEIDLRLLPTTALLAQAQWTRKSLSTAAMFAHPDYGTKKQNLAVKDGKRSLDLENITDLPGTEKERVALQAIFTKHGVTCSDFSGQNATEEAVKALQAPSILHVATHGFFFGDVMRGGDASGKLYGFSKQTLQENPLLRSGLLLAGCQKMTLGSRDGTEDGILTAFEASTLPLYNTQLVVLSACETGLGEIRNGEGVFGLQRAFLSAGARQIVMSLWKVDDEATGLFMTSFYARLMETSDTNLAFRAAQQTIKDQYKNPYYWGAFVIAGL